ncbi:acyl-CoA thioesterase, partial [Vibrio parahaemolyticus]
MRWGDMDAFGHVNNTLYFRFMEQCRIEWLEEVFGPTIAGEEGPVIVNAHC